jgi:hypothetical protein
MGDPMEKLVRGGPAQNQRRRLRRIYARRHTGQLLGPERAIGRVRSEHGHVSHSIAQPKAAHAITQLIDFPDHIIADHEWRQASHRLGVEMAPDDDVGVLQACGKHAHAHLTPAGRRHWSINYLQLFGTTKASELYNPVSRFRSGWVHFALLQILAAACFFFSWQQIT